MPETETAPGAKTATIDQAIQQVESLYRSVTGQEAPPIGNQPYAGIPPERAPEQHVEEQVDRLLDALGQLTGAPPQLTRWTPPLSVWETPEEVLIRLDLPGVPRQAVKITMTGGLLEVSGQRSPRAGGESNHYRLRYMESFWGEFRRAIPMPQDANAERLQAQLKDGVLEIRVARTPKPKEARTISVG